MWQSPLFKISQPEQATCHNPPLTKLTTQILPRHHLLHLTHETLTLISAIMTTLHGSCSCQSRRPPQLHHLQPPSCSEHHHHPCTTPQHLHDNHPLRSHNCSALPTTTFHATSSPEFCHHQQHRNLHAAAAQLLASTVCTATAATANTSNEHANAGNTTGTNLFAPRICTASKRTRFAANTTTVSTQI